MPLGRKHLRRSRDAPNVGWTMQRTASYLSRTRREVNVPEELDAAGEIRESDRSQGLGPQARSLGLGLGWISSRRDWLDFSDNPAETSNLNGLSCPLNPPYDGTAKSPQFGYRNVHYLADIGSGTKSLLHSIACTKLDPTLVNSNACSPSRLANSLHTMIPRTLLPLASSRGE
jgi:hypothetical protein